MATILHIARRNADGSPAPISTHEWTQAVERCEGVRMAKGDASAMNPLTGEAIVIANRGGDAEVWREDCQDWLRTFWWSPMGTIGFPAPRDESSDPTLAHARRIAVYLGAAIETDEGETFA